MLFAKLVQAIEAVFLCLLATWTVMVAWYHAKRAWNSFWKKEA